jgi:hypothetical protein
LQTVPPKDPKLSAGPALSNPSKGGAKRHYLNMTGRAWKQLRRNWGLGPSPFLLWQSFVPGRLFATSARLQQNTNREKLERANLKDAVVILGYWRSGTTYLHELLCLDARRCYPTTDACMNPHQFLLREPPRPPAGTVVHRPMDEMEVTPDSPQEDEFALLSLGARSPYEALLVPLHLRQALKLTDLRNLTPQEQAEWRTAFCDFARGVSVRGGGRPIIFKSPTHGYRVRELRELLPDARWIVITRDPATHFESVVKMWRKMCETYALTKLPPDDEIREAVLEDRRVFERRMQEDIADIPANRLATITYESLVAAPVAACERIYSNLELGDFEAVRSRIEGEVARRAGYRAQGRGPVAPWRDRINREWSEVFDRYGYSRL